jgi:SAM-dependent methyltransferase
MGQPDHQACLPEGPAREKSRMKAMDPTGFEPFSRRGRARARARGRLAEAGFLLQHARQELLAREALLPAAPAGPILDMGAVLPAPPGTFHICLDVAAARLPPAGPRLLAEEDRLPIRDGVLARIRSVMLWHGVNDLPGALMLARRALMPGGRLLAVFPAGDCLQPLREAFLEADLAVGGGVPARVGPTVDPAQGAGLLQRAGFLDPVAEVAPVTARYSSLTSLARDLRDMGETGWLEARDRRPMTRARWAAAEAAFAARASGGKTEVAIQLLFLSARAP